jgi:hypothetical protein
LIKRKADGAAWRQDVTCGLYSAPHSIAARTRHLLMPRHFAMTVNAPVTITAARRF